jgi:hypothetical protein
MAPRHAAVEGIDRGLGQRHPQLEGVVFFGVELVLEPGAQVLEAHGHDLGVFGQVLGEQVGGDGVEVFRSLGRRFAGAKRRHGDAEDDLKHGGTRYPVPLDPVVYLHGNTPFCA